MSVATVWTEPGPKRPVDKPALSKPAHPRHWVEDMTVAQKRWLSATGAVQTQALLGTKVYVLGTSGAWTHVAVSGQPTPKNPFGYPGWVPTRQLSDRLPVRTDRVAVVKTRTAWLWSDWGPSGVSGRRIMELSYDTRLRAVHVRPRYILVVTQAGAHRAIPRSMAVVHTVGAPWHPRASHIVQESRQFLGLDYLWAGTSGFGFDCSGFTYSVYHRAGRTIPRDADDQFSHGTPVALRDLRLGDLLFVRGSSGTITHVVMYDGVVNGQRSVIEAPHTGASVRVVPLGTYTYAGARRYLG